MLTGTALPPPSLLPSLAMGAVNCFDLPSLLSDINCEHHHVNAERRGVMPPINAGKKALDETTLDLI